MEKGIEVPDPVADKKHLIEQVERLQKMLRRSVYVLEWEKGYDVPSIALVVADDLAAANEYVINRLRSESPDGKHDPKYVTSIDVGSLGVKYWQPGY